MKSKQPVFWITKQTIASAIEFQRKRFPVVDHKWGYTDPIDILKAVGEIPSPDGWVLYSKAVEVVRSFRSNKLARDCDKAIDSILSAIKHGRIKS